jgi:1,4-dihydroxy-2-naphthoate octaprenyltransferase
MPQSRQRHGHHYQKPGTVPASQRVKGRIIWAILFAVFGFAIVYFASEGGWLVILLGALIGAVVGYFAGRSMEGDAKA